MTELQFDGRAFINGERVAARDEQVHNRRLP